MNEKNDAGARPRHAVGRAMPWAVVLSSMLSTPVLSAQTDISPSPITSSSAAQVKPNIMLLMDTSYSMGWGHMPDEVESQVGFAAIGYKAAECNVLYYNRNTTYRLPKRADGSFFPTPSFNASRYDAFNASVPTTVDLASAFKAYDDVTLRFSGDNDTPQPAYYYYKTGGTVPITAYNSSPCLDADVRATVPSSDGGTWNRVVVGSASGPAGVDERANFAVWHSYYRTRILLIKSAASLAFTPLTDSFRVGFITVRPKNSVGPGPIDAAKYLPIDDFTTTQRGLWYDKLFAQRPAGSSPTREGLARVGRHYAGMQDGINEGMNGDPVQFSCQQNFTIMTTDGYWNGQEESTGLSGGFIGGGVDITGKALVGQRDGSLNALTTVPPPPSPEPDHNFNGTPRPVWDGTFDGIRTVRNRTVQREYRPCGTYFSMTQSQLNESTSQLMKTTSQSTQSTVQRLQTTVQRLQSTRQTLRATSQPTESSFQTLKSTKQILRSSRQRLETTTQVTSRTVQNLQTTTQNLRSTTQTLQNSSQPLQVRTRVEQSVYIPRQSTTQNLQSTTQTRQSTSQLNVATQQRLQSTSQNTFTSTSTAKDTSQTVQNTTQTLERKEQNLQSTSQMLKRTAQVTRSTSQTSAQTTRLQMSTSQLQITTSQKRRSTTQENSCDGAGENCVPVPAGGCVAGAGITCETRTTLPTLVADCVAEPAAATNSWRAVVCTTTTNPPVPTLVCVADAASPSNTYTTTTCATVTTPASTVGSCTAAAAGPGNSYTETICSSVAGPWTYVASCTPSGPTLANGWVATACSTVSTPPTGVAACSPQTPDASNDYLTIACASNSTPNTGVAACTDAPGDAANGWVTTACTLVTTSNVPVASCTTAGPAAGNGFTTTNCATNNTLDAPVASCTAVPATGANSYTATICTANNSSVGSGTCTPDPATLANGWTERTCPTVTSSIPFVAPGSCTSAVASSANNWTATTCTDTVSPPSPYFGTCFADYVLGFYAFKCSTNTSSNVPVASCTPSGPVLANGYTTTTCADNNSALTPVASCTPVAATSANAYTATLCPLLTTTNVGVGSCTADPTPTLANSYTTTTCNRNDTTNVAVASCTVSGPTPGNGYTNTTCGTNNATNVAVASCTPSGPTLANNFVTTTCPPETLVSGPTVVASCTPDPATAANGYQRTDCNTVATSTPVQAGTCVPEPPSLANGWVGTTCNTALATVPVASCTPQTASAANGWVEIVCATNDLLNVPVLSCAASGANAGNSWTTTTCPSPIVLGPAPVGSCTASPATLANNWTRTTCPAAVTTPAVGVASCTNIPADSANSWTATVCGANNAANVPVQTCTAATGDGTNQWKTTTCADNDSLSQPAAACVAQTAASSNGWVSVTCPTPVETVDVPVATCNPDPFPTGVNAFTTTVCTPVNVLNTPTGSCVPVSPTLANGWKTTTCPLLATPPTGAASCTAQTGDGTNGWMTVACTANDTTNVAVLSCTDALPSAANGYTTTTCSDNNPPEVGVASCSAGPATAANAFTTTTCRDIVTANVPTGSCTPVPADASNGWTATTCPVLNIGPVGASSCVAGGPTPANLWTTTTCPGTVTTGPTPVGTCTGAIADAANSWKATTCTSIAPVPTIVSSCNPSGPTSANGYTTTTCTPVDGAQLQTTTHSRVQVFNVSNGVQSSTGTDNTTVAGPTASGACYAPGTQPPLPPNGVDSWTGADATAYPSCSGWPCTVDVNTANPRSVNSLADVAQYYYLTDLRTPANEPRGVNFHRDDVPGVGSGAEDDKARWQHMTTMAVALGVSGTLQFRDDYKTAASGDFADIRSGSRNWPLWPDPGLDYSNPTSYNNPRSIDDFWHAAVNGRGTFYSAKDPDSVIAGLAAALAGISSRVASSTGAGASNLEPVSGDNFAYLASYTTQKWTGEVQAREINLTTGLIEVPIIWSAKAKLDALTGGACDNRKIMLFRGGATNNLTNFSWNSRACDLTGNPTGAADTGLNAAEQAFFDSGKVSLLSQNPSMTDGSAATPNQRADAAGANMVNFLRGQRGLEGFVSGVANKLYRNREGVLGDIVNGQPTYVRSPFAAYSDPGYAAFKAATAGRTPMLYVAANDGMLHAFYAGTSITDAQGGKEAWAIIPTSVLPNLFKLADNNYNNIHQYYVDGTPTVSDINDGSTWRTVLVGGLNDGGKAYYAVDVTDPLVPKAMWEFKWSDTCYDTANPATAGADCHLGKTFGKPLISKLADGRWVVMVTSGYNNVNTVAKAGDGKGYLYVLSAVTGEIIYKIATTAGDSTTPSGLAQINNFVDKAEIDNRTVRVYGTDVLGNIWRFDVNDNTPPSGREATLVGTATDSAGVAQPITVRPELTEVGGKPLLYVATGRLLGATDTTDTQRQSVYGIIDPIVASTAFPTLRSALAPLRMTQVGSGPGVYRTVQCTGSLAQCGSADGWYVDLPDAGERVNVEMKLRGQTLIVGSNVPQIGACVPGGYSWLNYFDFRSGLAVSGAPGNSVSTSLANALIVGLTVIKVGSGSMPFKAIVTTSGAGVQTKDIPTANAQGVPKRVSWREVLAR